MNEPGWMKIARGYLGTREIAGSKHNSRIMGWLPPPMNKNEIATQLAELGQEEARLMRGKV